MTKLKELWRNNKVLIILGVILLGCFVAIICVTISFFLGGDKSVYGNRLDEIKNVKIEDSFQKEYLDKLKELEMVSNATMDVRGKVVYIMIYFVGDTTLLDAESKAALSLQEFSDEILSHYDIMFTLICEKTENSEGFTILGARNATGSGLNWNNNTPVESEEEK